MVVGLPRRPIAIQPVGRCRLLFRPKQLLLVLPDSRDFPPRHAVPGPVSARPIRQLPTSAACADAARPQSDGDVASPYER